jgi:hypothetical protein
MKFKLSYFLFLLVLVSCKDDNKSGMLTMRKTPKKESFFNINKDGFYDTPINETAEATVTTWTELRLFIAELKKPKKTIGAFSKSRLLFLKAMALTTNIPVQFNVPQIKVESQY